MSLSESQLRSIADSFFATLKDLDTSAHIALRAPECVQILAPASLNAPPPKNNQEFADQLNQNMRPLLAHFPFTAKETYVNVASRQITVWATGKMIFKKEAMGPGPKEKWNFVGEYIWVLDVNEEGKISRILEFLDSLATERLKGLVSEALENLGKNDSKMW